MKKLSIIILVSFLSLGLTGCSSSDNESITDATDSNTLSAQEQADLTVLREEEKLAKDVYLYAYDLYGTSIFSNISGSEQQHMDQVLTLLNIYNLEDPASTQRGVFANATLQTLYNNLTAQSAISLVEALKVGATIEDLDINDITTFESRTQNATILNVYDNLKCGSRNHLRSYTNQLTLNGVPYTPQYISATLYTEIINSGNEQCGN